MSRFILRRLGTLGITLVLVSLMVFLIVEVASPVSVCRRNLGQFATDEQVTLCEQRLGLDRPLPVRYAEFLKNAVTLDFGVSTLTDEPVLDSVIPRLGKTLMLAGIAFIVIMPLAVVLGILSALKEGRLMDRVIAISTLTATSIPEIATGIFLLVVFVGWLGWLPGATVIPQGDSLLQHPSFFVLPVLTLTLIEVGYVARITRASMIDVLDSQYIRTAYLKGLSYWKIVMRHALRNALLAPIAVIMLHVNWLIGGIVVTEVIFGYPGLGRFILGAALNRDVFGLEAATMILVLVAVGTQLIADVVYTFLNPRIRFG
ncbi:MAG: ABC transporter permease [Actinobacteria bacterium]|nr:ABC transporter permease [Actinomycetota bacterium]